MPRSNRSVAHRVIVRPQPAKRRSVVLLEKWIDTEIESVQLTLQALKLEADHLARTAAHEQIRLETLQAVKAQLALSITEAAETPEPPEDLLSDPDSTTVAT